mgnify:CR=1 FL=1
MANNDRGEGRGIRDQGSKPGEQGPGSRFRVSGFVLLFCLLSPLRADTPLFDEEPFAKSEADTPEEQLRKVLSKMGQVRERGARLTGAGSDGTTKEALEGIRRKQKEVEKDLAELVLVLQKG